MGLSPVHGILTVVRLIIVSEVNFSGETPDCPIGGGRKRNDLVLFKPSLIPRWPWSVFVYDMNTG
jgi:hypothetical protein